MDDRRPNLTTGPFLAYESDGIVKVLALQFRARIPMRNWTGADSRRPRESDVESQLSPLWASILPLSCQV